MAYSKQTWYDLPNQTTPVNAERLNHMEDGIEEAFNNGGEGDKIGVIKLFSGATPPDGWLICDGSAISRTTYSTLFSLIGTTYGSGDGSTTFNIPNIKGKTVVGLDENDTDFDTLGETGGNKNLQAHNHYLMSLGNGTQNMSSNNTLTNYSVNSDLKYSLRGADTRANSGLTSDTGTGDSGNLQPYITLNYIIKAGETTPIPAGQASIINTHSTSTTDGYSCNYINELATKNSATYNNFRTSELVINGSDQVIASVELVCTGKPILVSFSVPMHGAGNGSPKLKLWVDSTEKTSWTESVGTAKRITSYTTVITGVTAGTHTIKLYGSKNNDSSMTVDTYTAVNLVAVEL